MYKTDDAVWRIGLPKGSLNTPGRGFTCFFIKAAGYEISGYEPGKEVRPEIANDSKIACTITRPQTAPLEMLKGMMDATIIGEDWAQEYNWGKDWGPNADGTPKIIKIGDLGYGRVRLVAAISRPKKSDKEKSDMDKIESVDDLIKYYIDNGMFDRGVRLTVATEYPNLAERYLMSNPVYKAHFEDKRPMVLSRDRNYGDNPLVEIIQTEGATETMCDKGADFIIDNTQTGSALRAYGLEIVDVLMTSTAGLYIGPTCTGWKREKAEEFYESIKGAVVAKDYVMVVFNLPQAKMKDVAKILLEKALCEAAPTFSFPAQVPQSEEAFVSGTILIARRQYPETRRILRDNGAKGIVKQQPDQVIM